jgi:hypothetical protein
MVGGAAEAPAAVADESVIEARRAAGTGEPSYKDIGVCDPWDAG